MNSKVGDVHTHLPHLRMPSRTLSLLNNRGTFFLILVNSDPRAAAARLSLVLYHTLHNEFFSASTRTDSAISDRRRFLLQRVALLQGFYM